MRLLTLLLIVYHTQARVVDRGCEGVVVHNIIHEKEVLLHIDNSPYQLAIDYDTNTLFFSFTSPKRDVIFESGYLNLKTQEFHTIDGINGGFANAVDFNSHIVYLGGNDGIYTFNYDTKQAEPIQGTNHNMWQLFYKNNLYYTTYPDESVYIFKNGKPERVPELKNTKVLLVAVDNNEDIYFSNSSGLYVHTNNFNEVIHLGDYSLECFTADINGNLYFSTDSSIYRIHNSKIEKLVTMEHIYGMAVENDGSIIVGLYNTIVRLKPTKKQCIVQENKV